MGKPIKDGNLPYGTTNITILETGTVYVLNNFSESQDSAVVEQRDGNGIPTGQVVTEGFVSGSADCQLASATTLVPAIGQTFEMADGGYIVTSTGKTKENMGIWKCAISYRKCINPLVTYPATNLASATGATISAITLDAYPACTSFSATGLPTGITQSGSSIAGTPTTRGSFDVVLSATSPAGKTGIREIQWTIT